MYIFTVIIIDVNIIVLFFFFTLVSIWNLKNKQDYLWQTTLQDFPAIASFVAINFQRTIERGQSVVLFRESTSIVYYLQRYTH